MSAQNKKSEELWQKLDEVFFFSVTILCFPSFLLSSIDEVFNFDKDEMV